jgi:predicted ester cyclase
MEPNKTLALDLSRSIMKGDWARVDALLDDGFTYVGDGRPAMNKAQYVGFMRDTLCAAMKDMDMTFSRVVAEGDLVAVDYTNAMTHAGPFFGLPASGKRVMGTGQFMRQLQNGKVVAEWQTTNMAGLMAQLGAAK